VQRNIAAFGGDPDKVAIFGESAGAGIVDTLILAPPDPLPFRAAILQSGQGSLVDTNIGPRGEAWRVLLGKAGCPEDGGLECIRELPSQTLADLVQAVGREFKAVPGVETWPANPQYLRRNSTEEKPVIARVPVLIGSNDDEGQVFAYTFSGSTEDFLRDNLHISDQELIDAILDMYPIGSPDIPDERQQIAKISGDISFTCPLYSVAVDSSNVTIPTWRYLYNATFPEPQLYEGSGSFHTAELRPLFGTYNHDKATEEHHEISRAMQKAWADFAKDPQQGPGWAQHPEVGVFGAGNDGLEAFEATELQASDLKCETWLAALLG
jgi:cholinesterase